MKPKQCVLRPTLNHLKSLRAQLLLEQLSGAHDAAPGLLCSVSCPNSEKANLFFLISLYRYWLNTSKLSLAFGSFHSSSEGLFLFLCLTVASWPPLQKAWSFLLLILSPGSCRFTAGLICCFSLKKS